MLLSDPNFWSENNRISASYKTYFAFPDNVDPHDVCWLTACDVFWLVNVTQQGLSLVRPLCWLTACDRGEHNDCKTWRHFSPPPSSDICCLLIGQYLPVKASDWPSAADVWGMETEVFYLRQAISEGGTCHSILGLTCKMLKCFHFKLFLQNSAQSEMTHKTMSRSIHTNPADMRCQETWYSHLIWTRS